MKFRSCLALLTILLFMVVCLLIFWPLLLLFVLFIFTLQALAGTRRVRNGGSAGREVPAAQDVIDAEAVEAETRRLPAEEERSHDE